MILDYHVPPKEKRSLWIARTAAPFYFPGAELTNLSMVKRPGGNAKSHEGYWRSDCREAQLLGVLDRLGINESYRKHVVIQWTELGFSKQYLGPDQIAPFTSEELDAWTHQYLPLWKAATFMTASLPAFAASKVSVLHFVIDIFSRKKTNQSILSTVIGCESSGCAEKNSKNNKYGLAFVRAFLKSRDMIMDTLPLVLDITMPFLSKTDADRLARSFPIEWNISSKYEKFLRIDVLESVGLSISQLQNIEPHRYSSIKAALSNVLSYRRGWFPSGYFGGIKLDAALDTFVSLIVDDAWTRMNKLFLGLDTSLKLIQSYRGPFINLLIPTSISVLLETYILGASHICIDEVIAVVTISVYLLTHGTILWNLNIFNYNCILHTTARALRSWSAAVEFMMKNPPTLIISRPALPFQNIAADNTAE